MTREELKHIEHTTATDNNVNIVIVAEEGYKITDWKDSDDILSFNCFSYASLPVVQSYPDYRAITNAYADELEQRKQDTMPEPQEQ